MKAKVTRTLAVAWDGIRAETVEEGTLIEGERAEHGVQQGWAVELKDKGGAPEVEAVEASPENKARAAAPENKARGRK